MNDYSMYTDSRKSSQIMGLPILLLNQTLLFKDGKKRKLEHIEYRNMACDMYRFDDGTMIDTEDLYDKVCLNKDDTKWL